MPHSTYLPDRMGTAKIEPTGRFEAGSFASFTLTYTAGQFGIDDTGSIKVVFRFASDMGQLQTDRPAAPNYITAEASNGAGLDVRFEKKMNIRPWGKTLLIDVSKGYLREGDQIIIRFGDPRQGCPGMRLQTFCEETFEFRVLVDAIATCDYVELPEQPEIAIVPGPPVKWVTIIPTHQEVGKPFRLRVKGEDRWGNPSDQCEQTFRLRPSKPVNGLPETIALTKGEFSAEVGGLTCDACNYLTIDLLDDDGDVICRSNPMRVADDLPHTTLWGDLHGQSEETIGTNSARDYFRFARDRAFVDVIGHQGNDFQITKAFWADLNALMAEFHEPGQFITVPGYEWSGNTGLGGDRNVFYSTEDRPIYRSSHALVSDLSDIDTDATNVNELFDKLKDEDCIVHAHIGGRPADVDIGHDIKIERAFEVHSAWGTFEWLLDDAFRNKFRVGIVANSDGHKGRPGASYPGASMFGSYGGLTCFLAESFTRDGVFDALRRRHHYATTGNRIILDTRVDFANPATHFDQDPNMGPTETREVTCAMMGDIVRTDDSSVRFSFDLVASAPVERLVIRNGMEDLETIRPYGEPDLGRRVRVLFEGAQYRGRGRETFWNGSAVIEGNSATALKTVNAFNLDKVIELKSPQEVAFQATTTGGFSGFDLWLEDENAGTIHIDTEYVRETIRIADIGLDDMIFEAGGLMRRVRLFRLPDTLSTTVMGGERDIPLNKGQDNPIYLTMIQQDGLQAWSSPVYVFD